MNLSENPIPLLIPDSQYLITESLNYILQSGDRFIVKKMVSDKSELIKVLKFENIADIKADLEQALSIV